MFNSTLYGVNKNEDLRTKYVLQVVEIPNIALSDII